MLQRWQTIAKLAGPSAAEPNDIIMAAATSNASRFRYIGMPFIDIPIIGSVMRVGQVS